MVIYKARCFCDSGLVKAKLLQGSKLPPYIVVSCKEDSTTYSGRKVRFAFVAVFRVENEVGIDILISVG